MSKTAKTSGILSNTLIFSGCVLVVGIVLFCVLKFAKYHYDKQSSMINSRSRRNYPKQDPCRNPLPCPDGDHCNVYGMCQQTGRSCYAYKPNCRSIPYGMYTFCGHSFNARGVKGLDGKDCPNEASYGYC